METNFVKSNLVFILWFACYIGILYLLLYPSDIFFYLVILALVLLIIALSPIGEYLLRLSCGARKIKTNHEQEHLMPMFNSVYEDVISKDNKVSRNIKLFVSDDRGINGYAFGSNSIVLTRGTIETLEESEIKGILAHEFGHLRNHDTKILLLTMIKNFILNFFLFFLNLIITFFDIFLKELTKDNLIIWIMASPLIFIKFLIKMGVKFFLWLDEAILSINSRQNEYNADRFAYDVGYGNSLIQVLYILQEINMGAEQSFRERIMSSHPYTASRIERLESYYNE